MVINTLIIDKKRPFLFLTLTISQQISLNLHTGKPNTIVFGMYAIFQIELTKYVIFALLRFVPVLSVYYKNTEC